MIKGTETLKNIIDAYPHLVAEFEMRGLGAWVREEQLEKTGKFIRLNTLLSSQNFNQNEFIQSLNTTLSNTNNNMDMALFSNKLEKLDFLAMLPCGLRNPFKDILEQHIFSNESHYKSFTYLAEGNVNHEISYYPLLDKVESVDELPDIIISSDVNNCFHRPFMDRFIKTGCFEKYNPYTPNNYLQKVNFYDPYNNVTMLTANMLVMAVDTEMLGNRDIPQTWEDILAPHFNESITMRGEDNFFCNAVLLPLYKDHGMDAVKAMANNIASGKHPAEMVKMAESETKNGTAIYILPFFFAKKIKSDKVKIIWPQDGAIASPVFMLVKKNASEKYQKFLDFILSREMGEMFLQRFFPSIHPQANNSLFPESVKWLGWDFLTGNDIGDLKASIRSEFMRIWES